MKSITYATFAVAIIGLIWIVSCQQKNGGADKYNYEITYIDREGDTIVRAFTAPHIEKVLEGRSTLNIAWDAPCCKYEFTRLRERHIIAIIGSENRAMPWTRENSNGYAVFEDGSYWGYDYICLTEGSGYRQLLSLQKTGPAQ
jgi:hypothetical protein